jgi:glutaredoxin
MATQAVNALISQHTIVIFSKTTCGYCSAVKRLFDQLGQPYTAFELNKNPQGSAIQDYIRQTYRHRTVPAVFVQGQFVGGYDDTEYANQTGKLELLLQGTA